MHAGLASNAILKIDDLSKSCHGYITYAFFISTRVSLNGICGPNFMS